MFKWTSRILALFLGAIAYAVFVQSAAAQYRFDVWTTDQGLPHSNVLNIYQTSDGYLWLTTFNGLVRYDGVRFRVFNTGNTPGIKNSRFLMFYEDRERNLWITTEENGI